MYLFFLFYFIFFGMTLYMFRTVFPSIIRSWRLYVQQQAYVKQILLSHFLEWPSTCFGQSFRPSSGVEDSTYSNRHMSIRQQYLFDICLLLYVQSSTPDDGRKDCPKHVEGHSKKCDSSICLTYACFCMYSLQLLMMDGKTVRNM